MEEIIKRRYELIIDIKKGFCIHHNVEYSFDRESDMLDFLEGAIQEESIVCIKKIRKIIEYDFKNGAYFNKK